MRLIALPITVFAVMLLSIVPVSAQTVSLSATVANYGAVASCPATVKFVGRISASGWSPTANRQVQYKWIRSDGADAPTQTLNFPAGALTQTVTDTWSLGANYAGWEALQVSYPPMTNNTSNHANFKLTCPGPGSLTSGMTLTPLAPR
jgi:hypothetical protein